MHAFKIKANRVIALAIKGKVDMMKTLILVFMVGTKIT